MGVSNVAQVISRGSKVRCRYRALSGGGVGAGAIDYSTKNRRGLVKWVVDRAGSCTTRGVAAPIVVDPMLS